ncbi:Nucleoside phosphorylase [Cynara cardunculus var. scolymus]|uniref:Nucleoside phosphorylase n=1 Tax=Cynara cardunculus var. scolymus TaxID=59895 RepID=A0A103XZS5_CYNCS|nr:Nucleoside phosphorylase [Cynara cardunculus var. scolymus]
MLTKIISFFIFVLIFVSFQERINGALDESTKKMIEKANKNGPFLGLVIPNMFEMNPLLSNPNYKSTKLVIDYAGRRFRFGKIYKKPVILVMSGMGMVNAAIATQLLLSLFEIEGVIHYGIAGNANPNLNIGDVTIAEYWSHSALWNWQRYGDGPEDPLPFEGEDGFTREIGYMKFGTYSTKGEDNLLNNVWYQAEEVYPVDGTPEQTKQVFWIPVDSNYLSLSKSLEVQLAVCFLLFLSVFYKEKTAYIIFLYCGSRMIYWKLKLEDCINATTCLTNPPKVTTVQRGTSANIYLDNAAYRSFLYNKFNISPVEMESAGVALICFQQKVPFITFRALSDLAGGGTATSNEANTFSGLSAENSVIVMVEFVKLLTGYNRKLINSFW